jgi:hypothetical protein
MGVDGFAVTGDPLKQSLSGASLAIRDLASIAPKLRSSSTWL